jgi:formylglycine-generating enzyme required for sulfatase activity
MDKPDDFWPGGRAPAWADHWGWDSWGARVTLRVGDVTQCLRWIPAGEFLMGSPAKEKGRGASEGPQHPVRMTRGFWMFDTPCTQALWQAVMGNNSSVFPFPTHPVEEVSWGDCQEFVGRLNGMMEGLSLSLPSEAQWEYACRAGTQGARYLADLDAIAWYRKNSRGQTHPVGEKAPNAWGLYDMLGNLWEWCQDGYDPEYYAKSPRDDPIALPDASTHRVIRGGSWMHNAWSVRAAYRLPNEPSGRSKLLGFRCAEYAAPGPAGRQEGAE